jgi:hypothetical protein
MSVAKDDEGTCYYLCDKCLNACDIYVKPEQKPKLDCHATCAMENKKDKFLHMKPKSEDWMKKFDLWFDKNNSTFTERYSIDDFEDMSKVIKSFISRLLEKQREEIIKEVAEALPEFVKHPEHKYQDDCAAFGYNKAIDEVLEIIKQIK